MGKASKGSRKRKKAWRANVSTDDVDDFFEKQTRDAAAAIPSPPSDSLFYVDNPAASTSAASASDTNKGIPAKRNIEKGEEVLYHGSSLVKTTKKENKKKKKKAARMEFQETQEEKNVPMEDDPDEENLDISAGNGNGGTKPHKEDDSSDEENLDIGAGNGNGGIEGNKKSFLDADDGDEDVDDDDQGEDADTLEGQSVAEAAARKARIDHSSATVTILVSEKEAGARKTAVGSGFIIKLDEGRCKVMTCEHVLCYVVRKPHKYVLWVRYFRGDEDALATIQFSCDLRDIAVLDAPQFPAKPGTTPPTTLEFSKRRKIGTDVVLLGYFNPPAMERHFVKKSVIAKDPNSVPGKIIGPLRYFLNVPEKVMFPHSCYGIDETSGSPVILHESGGKVGKVLGIFHSSDEEIHWAIPTKTVKSQLILWLQVPGTHSMKDLIEML